MPYALDGKGRPVFLISNMAMHTQNLRAAPEASLFVAKSGAGEDPLGAARATLVGLAQPVSADDEAAARERYLTRHENSRYWVDFADFSFFRLEPVDLYYVGGFGVMGWVDAAEYARAEADPLASAAPAILAHMNADHVEAMVLLARVHAGLDGTRATMTSVDRLGFTLRVQSGEDMKAARINFVREARSSPEVRKVLVEMVRAAEAPSS